MTPLKVKEKQSMGILSALFHLFALSLQQQWSILGSTSLLHTFRRQLLPWLDIRFRLRTNNLWGKVREKCMPRPGIEPRTFRSSVWRSPNWAIAAIVTQGNASKFNSRSMNFILIEKSSEERFRSSDLWVMSPTRYRCATSLQVIQNVELTNLFNEHWFASVIAPVA